MENAEKRNTTTPTPTPVITDSNTNRKVRPTQHKVKRTEVESIGVLPASHHRGRWCGPPRHRVPEEAPARRKLLHFKVFVVNGLLLAVN